MTTGIKHDLGKPEFNLIPPRAELAMASVLTFGAAKYAPDNWKLVDNAETRYLAAAMRHINAYRAGEVYDRESRLQHLAHAMTCLAFLIELSPVSLVDTMASNSVSNSVSNSATSLATSLATS